MLRTSKTKKSVSRTTHLVFGARFAPKAGFIPCTRELNVYKHVNVCTHIVLRFHITKTFISRFELRGTLCSLFTVSVLRNPPRRLTSRHTILTSIFGLPINMVRELCNISSVSIKTGITSSMFVCLCVYILRFGG